MQNRNFYHCFATFTEPCAEQCRNDCVRFRYAGDVASQVWPSDQVINIAGKNSNWEVLRKCCATVSIRSATGETTVYESVRKYETIEFISYVGGLISLWLGFSVIGIYEYFNFFYHLVADRWLIPKEQRNRLPTPVYLSHQIAVGRRKVRRHNLDISIPKRSDMYGRKFQAKFAPSF
ncbi:hypothetical protein HDE_10281 [Halotydeus destructor]|nr:hypothetical protein HDE_10281 [Halotydeus destructor]